MVVIRKRLFEDEEAVSEVVGTILTLAITMVLFTSVFAAVLSMEGPDSPDHADFSTEYQDTDVDFTLSITHESGDSLDLSDTGFWILWHENGDRHEEQYYFGDDEVIEDEIDGDEWEVDEVVEIEDVVEEVNFDAVEEIELTIRNTDTNQVIYSTVLHEAEPVELEIRSAYVKYEYDWRNYAEPGDEVDIRARFESSEDIAIEALNVSVEAREEVFTKGQTQYNMSYLSGNLYNRTLEVSSEVKGQRPSLRIVAEYDENVTEEYVGLNVGDEKVDLYRPDLQIGDIDFEPRSPTHGDRFTLTANIYNQGRHNFTADWQINDNDVEVYDSEETFSHGPAPTQIEATWELEGDGDREIELIVNDTLIRETDNERIEDVEPENNRRSIEITVDPHVLIVRDTVPDGSREVQLMINALEALNLQYSVEDISEDALEEDNGLPGRDDFNESTVVVWMTGEETVNIDEDVDEELNKYISEDEGALWLIGSAFDDAEFDELRSKLAIDDGYDDLSTYDGDEDELTLSPGGENGTYGDFDYDVALQDSDLIIDSDNHEAEEKNTLVNNTNVFGAGYDEGYLFSLSYEENDGYYPLEEGTIKKELVDAFDDEGYDVDHDADLSQKDHDKWEVIEDEDEGEYFTIIIDGNELEVYDDGKGNRTAINPFLFERVMDPGQRSNLASEVIGWISGVESRTGVDVAVTSQHIEPASPMYMDEITITSTLRNNGPRDLFVTVRAERNEGEEVLEPEGEDSVFLEADGGTNTTTFTWKADELGVHEFIVIADYFNEIDQVNRRNTDIRYKDLDVTDDRTEVNVHYSTLVVDADGSLDDNEEYYNQTAELIDIFDKLGHPRQEDIEPGDDEIYPQIYENFIVEDPGEEDGPDLRTMREYNAVIWVTGERENDLFNISNMRSYLRFSPHAGGANLFLFGENILGYLHNEAEDNEDAEDLLYELGIDNDTIESGGASPDKLIGQEDNPLSHGLGYRYDSTEMDTFEIDDDTPDAEVLFKDGDDNNIASIRDDEESEIKAVYMGLNLSRIKGPLVDQSSYDDWPAGDVELGKDNAVHELIYTTMWQFGIEDDRTELRVVDQDIVMPENPHTGRSYEIRAEIQNIGYEGASALIRVKDGEDYIESESVYIDGSTRSSDPGSDYFTVEPGTTQMEVTWRPTHAGIRDIRVRVDPLRGTEEIDTSGEGTQCEDDKLMEFNNQAVIDHPVYFFHDDMETGEEWDHDTREVNIDGSGPIDFVDRDVSGSTNVGGEWDDYYSGMTHWDDDFDADQGYWSTGEDEDISEFTDNAYYSSPESYWMPETRAGGTGEREPIDMVVSIDTSASMNSDRGWWEHAYHATKEVARELDEDDRMAIFAFDYDEPTEIIGFDQFDANDYCLCDDHEETFIDEVITPNLGSVGDYDSGTPLYDTVSRAVQHLDEEARPEGEASRAGILLTDGAGNLDNDPEKYEPGTGDLEVDTPGPANYYDRDADYSGLLEVPYDFMTVTLGHLTRDTRLHMISATAQGENSFGVFEEEAEKLAPLFAMYTASVVEESEGGIRSADQETSLNSEEESIVTDFPVFSDGFLGGMDDHDETQVDLDGWETVYGDWTSDGFHLHEEWLPESDYLHEGYVRMARTSNNDDTLTHEIDPSETLDGLQGDVNSIDDVKVNFEFYTPVSGNWWERNAELALYVDGELIADGFTMDEYNMIDPQWEEVSIEEDLNGLEEPFEITFEHQGDHGEPLMIGHANVVYTLDYSADTGPSPEQTTSLESDESLSTSNDLHDYEDSDIETTIPHPYYRYMTTEPIEVPETKAESLSFRTKYWMTQGTNGGFMYLWRSEDGNWGKEGGEWNRYNRRYIRPDQSYTGNLHFGEVDNESESQGLEIGGNSDGLIDSFDEDNETLPYWAFNGKSGGGTFGWDQINVDLSRYEKFMEEHEEVRVVFVMAQMGGITEDQHRPEMGWYIDDVEVELTRDTSEGIPEDDGDLGYWIRANQTELKNMGFNIEYYNDSSGDDDGRFWMYASKDNNNEPVLPRGVDSSLYTSRISLVNAENPVLEANLRFNIASGADDLPSGLRVEISDDDGDTWNDLTQGVRTGWGVSGTGGEYSGEEIEGTDNWTSASSLGRFATDLSAYRGEHVTLRFRVYTNNTQNDEDFYADETKPKPIFIDNVTVQERDMRSDLSSFGLNSVETDLSEEPISIEERTYEDQGTSRFNEVQKISTSNQNILAVDPSYRNNMAVNLQRFEVDDLKLSNFSYRPRRF